MAPVTRAMLKKMAAAKVPRTFSLTNINTIRCTRSISRLLSSLGIENRSQQLPARIRNRRHTEGTRSRRSIRLLSASLPTSNEQQNVVDIRKKWCVCRQPDDHTPMIMCEGRHCQIQWFHMNCLKMVIAPRSSWFCPNCKLIL